MQTRRRTSSQPTTPKSSRLFMETWLKSPLSANSVPFEKATTIDSKNHSNSINGTESKSKSDNGVKTSDSKKILKESTTPSTTSSVGCSSSSPNVLNSFSSPVPGVSATSSSFRGSHSAPSRASSGLFTSRLNPIHEASEHETDSKTDTEEVDLIANIIEKECNSSKSKPEQKQDMCGGIGETSKKTNKTDNRNSAELLNTSNGQTPPNKGLERKFGSERIVKRRLINKYGGSCSTGGVPGNISNGSSNNKSKTPQPTRRNAASSGRYKNTPKSENIRTLFLSAGSKKRKRVAAEDSDDDVNGNEDGERGTGRGRKCSKALKLDCFATHSTSVDENGASPGITVSAKGQLDADIEKENNLKSLTSSINSNNNNSNNNNNNDIGHKDENLNTNTKSSVAAKNNDDDVFMTSPAAFKKVLQESTSSVTKDLLDIAED